jgi:hypothetical protein
MRKAEGEPPSRHHLRDHGRDRHSGHEEGQVLTRTTAIGPGFGSDVLGRSPWNTADRSPTTKRAFPWGEARSLQILSLPLILAASEWSP